MILVFQNTTSYQTCSLLVINHVFLSIYLKESEEFSALGTSALGASALGTSALGAATLAASALGTSALGAATLGAATLGAATLGTSTLGISFALGITLPAFFYVYFTSFAFSGHYNI